MIHVNDPAFIDEIYTGPNRRRDKSNFFCRGVPTFHNIVAFSTELHDPHRALRTPLSPFFSRQKIRQDLEPIIQRSLSKVSSHLAHNSKTGEPINLRLLFMAMTNDIITAYAFGKSWDSLDHDDVNGDFFEAFHNITKSFHANSYHSWFFGIMMALPEAILARMAPTMQIIVPYFIMMGKQVAHIQSTESADDTSPSVIRQMLDSDQIPPSIKTTERLVIEGQHLLAGGTDTSAETLAAIFYSLLVSPDKLQRLKEELASAMPNNGSFPTVAKLETLPYLNAVITETLRLHSPVTFPMERIAPDEDLRYTSPDSGKEYVIPKGTTIAMTQPILNRSTAVYGPDATAFRPERFLENPKLENCQLTFGRGTRRCLGEPLARSELLLVTACLFHRYSLYDKHSKQSGPTLELYDTDRERDVEMAAAFILPFRRKESKGVRVVVRD